MKKIRLPLTGIVLLAAAVAIPTQAMAQWNLALSYQIREEAPKYGYGIRLEREILQKLPLVELGLRAHFAYFNENNNVSRSGATFGEITYYDYGVGAYAGLSLGLLKPYVGIGIGASTFSYKKIQQDRADEGSKTAFSYSGFIGVEVTPIPRINPFIEYRLEPVDEAGEAFNDLGEEVFNSNGRLLIGVSISF